MKYQYKIIVSNKTIYKEFEIPIDMEKARLGTTLSCEFRLNPNSFFGDIILELERQEDCWEISCDDFTYISKGDMRKLLSTNIRHGDILTLCYADSGDEVFMLHFMIDFESQKQQYNAKINLLEKEFFTIGYVVHSDLVLLSEFCEGCNLTMRHSNNQLVVDNITSPYGVYHNGKKIDGETNLEESDFIQVADISFYYKGGNLYFDSKKVSVQNGIKVESSQNKNFLTYPLFNRNTRLKNTLNQEPIEILDPPTQPEKSKSNIVMSLLPAIIMLVLTVLVRGFMSTSANTFIIISIASMGLGIFTSIASFINEGKEFRKKTKERFERYTEYIDRKREQISHFRQQELDYLNDTYLDLYKNTTIVKEFDGRLFERTEEDEDYLKVFIGRGKVEALREVKSKKQESYDVTDELFELPSQLTETFKYIENAPIVADFFNSNAIGVLGNEEERYTMFKNIVLDLSIRHYYLDVQIFVLIGEENVDKFSWIRLLPHIQLEVNNNRNIVCDNESKNNIFEYLYKELTQRSEKKEKHPYFIIMVLEEMGIKNHPISQFVSKASEINTTFVFFDKAVELLPLHCNEILYLQDCNSGYLVNSENKNIKHSFNYSTVSDREAEEIVNRLAPVYCEEISLESSLRKSISFYELLNIFSVEDIDLEQNWNLSKVYKSMAAPLGVNSKNEVIYLDLHEKFHGPHGLVAGTTGSGKSEILQSYILSAATLFHPHEVGFVIIDFKGGGMANQFEKLPHLVGTITNIDGKEIDRSLKSIKAELLKRQGCFSDSGVNHIDKYIQLYKKGEVEIPLPHLIIIVDEFAELKAEQPEFMKELISASRIGRSLGVHLILATQKPAGQVNEQIWSNSRFKLCLKVQSKEDSNEVIKTPVAAEIREPGRAYLQVGNNEIFELFQSGFSGAPATMEETSTKEFTIKEIEFSGKKHIVFEQKKQKNKQKDETQLEALINYLSAFCIERDVKKLDDICLPSLKHIIDFPKESFDIEEQMSLPIGIYDDPDNQYQGLANVKISNENTIIIGSSQSGKTNLLQTVIRGLTSAYSPGELNIYIIDFASMVLKNFEKLNHVGGVVCPPDDEKLKNLFKLLHDEIEIRKEKLIEVGVSSFNAYKEAGETDLPQIVLIIDNFAALKELYFQDGDELLTLCREGLSVGISIILTNSQTSGIGYKYMSNFSYKIAMFCNDSSEYATLFNQRSEHIANIPGRCLIETNKKILECQVFLAFKGEKEIDRVGAIKDFISLQNQKNKGMYSKMIPVIPETLTDVFIENEFSNYMQERFNIVIGIDYETVTPFLLNLAQVGCFAISGKEELGKDNFVKYIMSMLDRIYSKQSQVYIIDGIERELSGLKEKKNTETYSLIPEDAVKIIKEMEVIVKDRYDKIVIESENILHNSNLLILVVNNNDALNAICEDKDALNAYKNITGKYKNMNICIIASAYENTSVPYGSPEIIKDIRDSRHIFYFDDMINMKIFDIPLSVSRNYKKQIETCDCYYIKGNEYVKLKTAHNTK